MNISEVYILYRCICISGIDIYSNVSTNRMMITLKDNIIIKSNIFSCRICRIGEIG